MSPRRHALRTTLGCAAVAVGLLLPAAAQANTPILFYSALPSTTQAGGHPDLEVRFSVSNRFSQHSQSACNCEDVKDAIAHLPTGFIGDPHASPSCSIADFAADACPIDSQIGIASVDASLGVLFNSPIYNLVPPPQDPGLLGFKIVFFDTPQFTVLSARTGGDYGLDAGSTSIFHGSNPLKVFQQVIWGVPADPSHDAFREDPANMPNGPAYLGYLCDANGAPSTADPSTVVKPCKNSTYSLPPISSNSPLSPFLQNPTTCDTPLSSSLDILSYDGGTDHADAAWPQGTGCDQLSFNPSLFAQPTTSAADSPSGIDVNLSVPQQESPTVPAPTELRGATVTLPPGFSINPNAADGKSACTDLAANIGTGSLDAANCPDFAKVGSLEIDSSALPGPLPGFVYLGAPLPGNRYRIFLVADGFATHIKLAGTVTPDPVTGQLVITFKDLPQSPLTEFNMHFFGSERGVLATPIQCGTYPVKTTFTPWDSALPAQTSTQFFTLDQGPNGTPCPAAQRPFNPRFEAASAGNTAGAHTPFSVDVQRDDGDQFLGGLSVTTPPGFSATLKGITYCPQSAIDQLSNSLYSGLSEIASPACPADSQIGTAVAGAGAGNHPLYVGGKVYLAGPYQGAPLSLIVVIPAVSGPYDLGNVAVRAAIHVDPLTAQVTTVSDRLPQILEGIPLRTRSIRVNLDRPNFALNPTNCDPRSVDAQISGDQGAAANLSAPYQVANCASLPFAPKLALRLTGPTLRNGHPALHATLTARAGDANLASTAVTLPPTEQLDQSHLSAPCTKAQFSANSCPAASVIGSATATTPILDQQLSGPVYLETRGNLLPDVVATLQGPPSLPISFQLAGKVDTVNGGLRTTFATVPDVPVTSFHLDLLGDSKGLIVNNANICRASLRAMVRIAGQNGRNANQSQAIGAPCGKARHKRHRAVHHARKAG